LRVPVRIMSSRSRRSSVSCSTAGKQANIGNAGYQPWHVKRQRALIPGACMLLCISSTLDTLHTAHTMLLDCIC
jgi:hypothetical protein